MTTVLTPGANVGIPGLPLEVRVRWDRMPPDGLDIDVSLFVLGENGRVRGDDDMVFYNQQQTKGGEIRMSAIDRGTRFRIDALPPGAHRLAVAAVVDDRQNRNRRLSEIGGITIEYGTEAGFRLDLAGSTLRAAIMGEVYLRNGQFKVKALGQGFDGGLEPLSRHFGMDVAPMAQQTKASILEERLVSLEKSDPKLVDLAKKAGVSLAKTGAAEGKAKVALVLDVSGSMHSLFSDGSVDRLVQRALAFGLNLDDDGDIDVFIFDSDAIYVGTVNAGNYRGCATGISKRRDIWGGTDYAKAMKLVRRHYGVQNDGLPVYVMFVTDGGTSDRKAAEKQMIEASREGFFWKFMAIGRPLERGRGVKGPRGGLPTGFDFLAYLDDMPGRLIDNANAFTVESPDAVPDEEFYDLMTDEYASWTAEARARGIVR